MADYSVNLAVSGGLYLVDIPADDLTKSDGTILTKGDGVTVLTSRASTKVILDDVHLSGTVADG